MSENAVMEFFLSFWIILDMIFTFVEQLFVWIFDGIPIEAIPFLIGIFCYSVSSFFVFFISVSEGETKRLIFKVFYGLFFVITIFFTVWRFGFIFLLDYVNAMMSFSTLATFFISIGYIMFAVVLFIAFYKKIPWLRTAIIILLWTMFLLLTFIIVPAMEWEYGASEAVFTKLSSSTLFQVLMVGTIFVVPRGLNKFKKIKEDDMD